ncbi:MAG: hypothetical protein IKO72_13355 [Kiritimatiellae bacterium]|nr:hypothetical protein [Kiritimatiellia bacterium]
MTNLTLLVSLMLGTPQVQCAGGSLGTLVRDQLFNEAMRLDRAADAAWTECTTRSALAARQTEVRRRTIEALGGFPEKTPLNARTTGRVQKEGYVIEKVLFESRPGHYVTAHLFLPDDPMFKPPYPGAVSPCGHSLAGKNAPWYQRVGVTGAKLGVATLVYDPIEQGERHQLRDGRTRWSTTAEHNRAGYRATLLGWDAAQFRIWDGIRACDYLSSRPEVDAERLGVTGLSGGGTLSSYLNALDSRYLAGAPAGFLSTARDVFDNCGPQDAEQVIFGQLRFGFNHLGIVALRAPSPVMIVTSHADFFPFMGSVDTFESARQIYSMLGVPERVELMETAGPHHWYESTRHAAFWWIRRWAAGDRSAWPRDLTALRRMDLEFDAYTADNSGLAFEEPAVYNVTDSGFTLDIPGARSVYDIMRDELARLDAGREALTPERVRSIAGVRPLDSLGCTPVARKETAAADGRVVRMLLSRDDDLVPVPLVAFLPAAAKGTPVILFTDGDRKSLEADVGRLLAEGRAVAVAEMRGFGETAKGRKSFYGSSRADEEMAMLSFAIGENLVARRAEDAAIAARGFASLAGVEQVAVVASGATAIPAAHAFFLERALFASFEARKAPASWRKVLEDPNVPYAFADTVHGALRAYDWADLAK